jgi:uncharacterized protein with FMN-binding domain
MKRAYLIAGGTVGGLGAVLAITPPQLSSGDLNIAGGTAIGSVSTSASASSSPSTQSSKPVATKKATAAATAAANGTAATTEPAPQAPAASTTAVSGTFTGPSVNVNYGNVQVQITVVNGRITDAVAVKAPSGKNDRYTNMAVPTLKQQTLAAQSANIKGVSGASYTSYGWFTSLQGALAQAGL